MKTVPQMMKNPYLVNANSQIIVRLFLNPQRDKESLVRENLVKIKVFNNTYPFI